MRVTLTVDLPMTEAAYRDEHGVKPGSSGGLPTLAAAINDCDAHADVRIELTDTCARCNEVEDHPAHGPERTGLRHPFTEWAG